MQQHNANPDSSSDAGREKTVGSLREALLAKLAHARTVLVDLERQASVEITAIEWQKGYVKALEEALDLEDVSLRRYPRRLTSIPTEIVRILPETGAPWPHEKGTIIDLSVGGCGLTTALELSVGEAIALFFKLPESGMPVTVEAWVRRAQRVGEEIAAEVEFKVGAEFKGAPRPLSRD